MKKLSFLFSLQTIISTCNIGLALAQTGVNIHIGQEGIDIKPDAFISYYQAPPDRAVWLQQQKIPEAQWPLLFEVARAANVTLDRVLEVRRQQSSWQEVLNLLNVPSSYFYYKIPAELQLPPPYGHAYGYYQSRPSEAVRWSDLDLYKLASVKYISDSTHRPVDQAVIIYQNKPHFIHSNNTKVIKQKQNHKQNYKKNPKQNNGSKPGKSKKNNGHKNKRGHR